MDSDNIKFFSVWMGIIFLLVGLALYTIHSSEKECRGRGGVPITINGAVNCAKEGFIDYRV